MGLRDPFNNESEEMFHTMGPVEEYGLYEGKDAGMRQAFFDDIDTKARKSGYWYSKEIETKLDEEELMYIESLKKQEKKNRDPNYLANKHDEMTQKRKNIINKLKQYKLYQKTNDENDPFYNQKIQNKKEREKEKKQQEKLNDIYRSAPSYDSENEDYDDVYYHPKLLLKHKLSEEIKKQEISVKAKKRKEGSDEDPREEYSEPISSTNNNNNNNNNDMDIDTNAKTIDDMIDTFGHVPQVKTMKKKLDLRFKVIMGSIYDWKKELEASIVREIEDHQGDDIVDVICDDERLSLYSLGEELFNKGLKAVEIMAEKSGIVLTETQIAFIKNMFEVNLPHIYKDEFARCKHTLLKRMNRKEFQRGAFLSVARQAGKSTM